MKTTIRIFASVLAASLVFVSCAKQEAMDNGNTDSVGGVRTIAVSFAKASVKSTLGEDGLTPKFVATDVIKVSNGTATEECNVSIEGDVASITTKLSGALTMVYPAAAWSDTEPYFKVSTEQDGTFASANICKATIAEGAAEAQFANQTAVLRFYVGASIGVKSIEVSSTAANIADGSNSITVDPAGEVTLDSVTDDPGKRICYVAVLPVTESTDLTYTSVTTTQTTYPDNTVSRTVSSITLAKNTMYNAFIPYYINLGAAGKWAYCNIGAFLPEDYGEYFAWGETTGHKANSEKTGFEDGHSFDWVNCPYQTQNPSDNYSTKFTKYLGSTTSSYKDPSATDADALKTVLDPEDDAARVNWGGSWRMPTMEEFGALASETKVWDSTNKGYTFGTSPNQIFLPAAGYGDGTGMINVGSGYYWSSLLNTDSPSRAMELSFFDDRVYLVNYYRYSGQSVRPFSE